MSELVEKVAFSRKSVDQYSSGQLAEFQAARAKRFGLVDAAVSDAHNRLLNSRNADTGFQQALIEKINVLKEIRADLAKDVLFLEIEVELRTKG
jgi:hypothetical protein